MAFTRLIVGSAMMLVMTTMSVTAAETSCAMSYETYEFSTGHIDLAQCPTDLAGENRFCRASVAGDQLHVAVFAQDGDQCLVTVKSYDEEQFDIVIKSDQ